MAGIHCGARSTPSTNPHTKPNMPHSTPHTSQQACILSRHASSALLALEDPSAATISDQSLRVCSTHRYCVESTILRTDRQKYHPGHRQCYRTIVMPNTRNGRQTTLHQTAVTRKAALTVDTKYSTTLAQLLQHCQRRGRSRTWVASAAKPNDTVTSVPAQ
jgi:hypothetical protein